jgi:hypothetical protein
MTSTGGLQMAQNMTQTGQQFHVNTDDLDTPVRRPYVAPQLMVMDETEVLKVFQITSAGVSWWG